MSTPDTPHKMGDPNMPVNDLQTTYKTLRDSGELPPGMTKWPAVTAMEPSRDGKFIYIV